MLIPWLEEQDALDLSVDMSDAQLDSEIIKLLKQIPEFADDGFFPFSSFHVYLKSQLNS